MNSREREPSAHRPTSKDDAEREPASAVDPSSGQESSPSSEKSPASRSRATTVGKGPRLWALPKSGGGIWPLWEESELAGLSLRLRDQAPQIQCAHGDRPDEMITAASHATDRMMRRRGQDSLFAFSKGLLISGAFMLAGIIAWRLPGELKFLDLILLLTGAGYFTYNLFFHGRDVLQWHHRRVDAVHAYQRGSIVRCKLCDRLAKAMHLRLTLKEIERGKSPDDELLDTNAYRKLIEEGVTTAEELSRLGRAIDEQLNIKTALGVDRKMSEVAAEAGVDLHTAIFYRDLANAAAEIRMESHINEAFGETKS